jgi:hypothetical protein
VVREVTKHPSHLLDEGVGVGLMKTPHAWPEYETLNNGHLVVVIENHKRTFRCFFNLFMECPRHGDPQRQCAEHVQHDHPPCPASHHVYVDGRGEDVIGEKPVCGDDVGT